LHSLYRNIEHLMQTVHQSAIFTPLKHRCDSATYSGSVCILQAAIAKTNSVQYLI